MVADFDMPEFYEYVRDKLDLLPTIVSMKKQHMKMTIRPDASSPRNFTFTASKKRLNDNAVLEYTTPISSSEAEMGDSQSIVLNFFGDMFNSEDSSPEWVATNSLLHN